MANFLQRIGEDILHAIEIPFKFASKAKVVLDDVVKDAPELKAGILKLVTLGEAVVGDVVVDVRGVGLNLPDDIATIEATKVFFAYLKGEFFPLIGSVYADIKGDIEGAPKPLAVVTVAAVDVAAPKVETDLAPGLYHVTAEGAAALVLEAPLPSLEVAVLTGAVAGAGPLVPLEVSLSAAGPGPVPVPVAGLGPVAVPAAVPVAAPINVPAGAQTGPGLHNVTT